MKYLALLTICLILFVMEGYTQNNPESARNDMVKYQIKKRGITDERVLKAMRVVPRHLFVPLEYREDAYNDHPLPIGFGQTISQPYIVAFMSQALELKKTDKVLEIGTGSGYQAAILAEICDSVYSIEIVPDLARRAGETLAYLGYNNVFIKSGDGYLGWPEHAPFDALIVTCAPTHVPEPLVEQMAEGGRMIIPVGKSISQNLVLMEKKDGKLVERDVLPVRFVPMLDKRGGHY